MSEPINDIVGEMLVDPINGGQQQRYYLVRVDADGSYIALQETPRGAVVYIEEQPNG